MSHPDNPITEADWEESGPGSSVSIEQVVPVSKRKSTYWPPTVINTRGSSGAIWKGLVWGSPGSFSPDCLGSPTPETYASGGRLSSSVILCRPDMEPGVA